MCDTSCFLALFFALIYIFYIYTVFFHSRFLQYKQERDRRLDKFIKGKQCDWQTKLILAHGVICGMEYLHNIQPHPVIHGDLKMQNVLVGDGPVAKITDFGLSKWNA